MLILNIKMVLSFFKKFCLFKWLANINVHGKLRNWFRFQQVLLTVICTFFICMDVRCDWVEHFIFRTKIISFRFLIPIPLV